MRTIKLNKDKKTLVDDEDYDVLNKFKWYTSDSSYAVRNQRKEEYLEGKRTVVKMHRVILGIKDKTIEVDHINGNRLDNRKSNLRACGRIENARNNGGRLVRKSWFKGVTWYRPLSKWKAQITFNKKCIFLGYFDREGDAAKRYDESAVKEFGKFARLNFKEKE